ncbi:hypothetical protein PIB30_014087 [Stylosanthes scabra]|uniref:Uncharacterized protein n=1 Tax=Stylosanthes scabra TaxID=79078 RepID=A0ABU6R5M5_9FABA|nr:hypothetical protein [Stylosanthes scabra]
MTIIPRNLVRYVSSAEVGNLQKELVLSGGGNVTKSDTLESMELNCVLLFQDSKCEFRDSSLLYLLVHRPMGTSGNVNCSLSALVLTQDDLKKLAAEEPQ